MMCKTNSFSSTNEHDLNTGNMEEGLRDHADMTRHTVLVLPATWHAFRSVGQCRTKD